MGYPDDAGREQGGAAAAVAAGRAFADGSDLAASAGTRRDGSLVGLRTTPGMIPSGGDFFNPLPVLGRSHGRPPTRPCYWPARGHDPALPLARPARTPRPGHRGAAGGDGVSGLRVAWSADLGGLPVEPEVARGCPGP